MSRSDFEAAMDPLGQAVESFPDYAPARGLLAFCLVFAAHMGWIERDRGLLPGREHAARAIALDDRDPWGHIALGYWALMEWRTEESIAAFARRSPSIRIPRRPIPISVADLRSRDGTARRSSTVSSPSA